MFGRRPGGFNPSTNLGLEIGGHDYGPPPPFYSPSTAVPQAQEDPQIK